MKRWTIFLIMPLCLFLSGCAAAMMGSSSKNDKHQTEMALHKARTDLEELRCDLNSTQSQLQILSNKMNLQEQSLASLKQETINQQQTKLDQMDTILTKLEKQLKTVAKLQVETFEDLQGLASQAADAQTALSQYKEKMSEVEHKLAAQSQQLEDIAKSKDLDRVLSQKDESQQET